MPFYKVNGLVDIFYRDVAEDLRYRDSVDVDDLVVEASNITEALGFAMDTVRLRIECDDDFPMPDDMRWVRDPGFMPQVDELPVDQTLRMLGAATLPGFEDV